MKRIHDNRRMQRSIGVKFWHYYGEHCRRWAVRRWIWMMNLERYGLIPFNEKDTTT